MTKTEIRQQYILTTANENGFASISECAHHLNVSIETIRRDINKLCAVHLLKKIHGGAAPVHSIRKDSCYKVRFSQNRQEKNAVGMEAAALIRSGMIVALDCGASIQAIAHSVCDVQDVVFVTNSVPTASILLDKISVCEISGRVIMIGGELHTQNHFSKGAAAVDEVDKYYFDIAFISCTAVSTEAVFAYDPDEGNYSKHLIRHAAETVLIADSVKLNKNSTYAFAAVTDFNKVIIDDQRPVHMKFKKHFEKTATELIVARTCY